MSVTQIVLPPSMTAADPTEVAIALLLRDLSRRPYTRSLRLSPRARRENETAARYYWYLAAYDENRRTSRQIWQSWVGAIHRRRKGGGPSASEIVRFCVRFANWPAAVRAATRKAHASFGDTVMLAVAQSARRAGLIEIEDGQEEPSS